MDIQEEIKRIEEEIRNTKYNKATESHIGKLKAKLARLREEVRKKTGKGGKGYGIKKTGDARIVLVGFPSVGKSTLLNKLTNAESKVGDYEFTTLDVIPGMMEYNGAKIQILDVPGLIEKGSKGRGRGKEVLSVIRTADLVLILVDARKPEQEETIRKELYDAGFRLDRKKPDIIIKKRSHGGLDIKMVFPSLSPETVKSVLQEFKVLNAEVLIRDKTGTDDLVDVLIGNRVYTPSLVIANKTDLISEKEKKLLEKKDILCISAVLEIGLNKLREKIWEKLGLIRVYSKKIGKGPEKQPMIVKKGSTVWDVCERIHKEFARHFDYAKIWGKSAKFPGQRVGKEYVLSDGDIVEIHLKK